MTNRDLIKKRKVQVAFEALSIEGGLVSPEWLSKIAHLQADAQSDEDYKVPKGLNLRDEIGRYWRIAEALWNVYQSKIQVSPDPTKETETFITNLLKQCLGFDDLQKSEDVTHADHVYPVGLVAGNGHVPIVISSPQEGLDALVPRFGETHRKRTAFGLIQEYLNASEEVLWGIACDGETLRIVRDNASLTKPVWIEADLKRIFQEGRFADFAAFWLICHRTRFGEASQQPNECILERWREFSRTEGTRAQDHLRVGVEEALEILGQGFLSHPDNKSLREVLQSGSLSTQVYFQELLRLVYQLIFLITIEERGLLHPTETSEGIKSLYQNGYSLKRLRDRAIKRNSFDRFSDLWESLKIVFKGIGKGQAKLGLPALGGLFGEVQNPTIMTSKIENRYLLQAVLKLCWLKEESGVSRVNWRDMGPEELGSVYESLLELVPQLSDHGQVFGFARGGETKGNARKLSGSYYTPDSLVQSLLNTALEPVIETTIANNLQNTIEALLGLSIIDPACGSGHFLLAAARRLAGHVARLQAGGTPTAREYRKALRQVIGRCIYGVDKNPMALELARTALWLEAMTPDLPLSFLDHHLICGDAIVGLIDLSVLKDGIPNEAYKVLSGDDREVSKQLTRVNRETILSREQARASEGQESFAAFDLGMLERFSAVERMPDDTLDATERKQTEFQSIQSAAWDPDQNPIGLAADMFVTAFLAQKSTETKSLVPTTFDLAKVLHRTPISGAMKAFVRSTAKKNRVLHWKLKFPQIFSKGGFDVVLGNPPWERVKLVEKEWFASRDVSIANATNASKRKERIEALADINPSLFAQYTEASHRAEGESHFLRNSGVYPLCGMGDINLYSVFAERMFKLLASCGRNGCVLPTGIATDDTNKVFIQLMVKSKSLVSFFDFTNRGYLFPNTESTFCFCLLTLSQVPQERIRCAGQIWSPSDLANSDLVYSLSQEDVLRINPNTANLPIFRSAIDAGLIRSIYRRIPVLVCEDGADSWKVKFSGMFHMTNDSGLFRSRADLEKMGAIFEGNIARVHQDAFSPLYEAKLASTYNHRSNTFAGIQDSELFGTRAATVKASDANLQDPEWMAIPRYWTLASEVGARTPDTWSASWFMGFRNAISAVADARTTNFTVFPKWGAGNSLPLLLPGVSGPLACMLLANFNSFVLDYVVKQKASGGNLNFYIVKQLPILPPELFLRPAPWAANGITILDWLLPRVVELIYNSYDLETFANDCGYPGEPFRWNIERRDMLRCEIDAAFFYLYLHADYGFSSEKFLEPRSGEEDLIRSTGFSCCDAVSYILDSFPVARRQDEARFNGEYRTKRLIIEYFGDLVAAVTGGKPYKSRLIPEPCASELRHSKRGHRVPSVLNRSSRVGKS